MIRKRSKWTSLMSAAVSVPILAALQLLAGCNRARALDGRKKSQRLTSKLSFALMTFNADAVIVTGLDVTVFNQDVLAANNINTISTLSFDPGWITNSEMANHRVLAVFKLAGPDNAVAQGRAIDDTSRQRCAKEYNGEVGSLVAEASAWCHAAPPPPGWCQGR